MEDGRSVGGEFSGTSDLKSGCGKGCRLSCLSTGSRRPVSGAGGVSVDGGPRDTESRPEIYGQLLY